MNLFLYTRSLIREILPRLVAARLVSIKAGALSVSMHG